MSTTKHPYAILLTIMLVTLLSTAGVALPYPVLAPLFAGGVDNALNQFAGWDPKLLFSAALATYPLGMLIGSSVIGALSDSYGRKKTLLLSLLASVVGYGLTGLAIVAQDYLLFLLARFATGLFEGNMAITRAIASELHPQIDKTRAFSWLYGVTYGGWLVGPLAGGYLMAINPQAVFYVAAIAVLLSALAVVLLVPRDQHNHHRQRGSRALFRAMVRDNSFGLLSQPPVRRVFYVYLLLTLGLNAFYEFYPLWLVEYYAFKSVAIGHATAVQTLFMVLVSMLLVEPMVRRFGRVNMIYLAAGLFCTTLLINPWLPAFMVWPYFALTGGLIAAYNALIPVYIGDTFANEGQGKLMGLLASTFFLANALIALLAGPLSLFGSTWSIFFGGLLIATGLWGFYRFDKCPPIAATAMQE